MGFIKTLIGLPIIIVLLVFAFVNNDLANFILWPFSLELTVSLRVAILFFVVLGFLLGSFFSWLSYAPLRKDLRQQKKKNKKLSKQQQILTDAVTDLQGDLEQIKAEKEALMPEKPRWWHVFKKKNSADADSNTENGKN